MGQYFCSSLAREGIDFHQASFSWLVLARSISLYMYQRKEKWRRWKKKKVNDANNDRFQILAQRVLIVSHHPLSLSVLFCLRNYVHATSIITLIDIMLCVRVPLIVGNVSYVVWKCNFSLNIIIFCRIDTNCNNNDDFCFCRVESKSFFDFTNSNNSVEFKMEIRWKAIFTNIFIVFIW